MAGRKADGGYGVQVDLLLPSIRMTNAGLVVAEVADQIDIAVLMFPQCCVIGNQ